jgi:response regulator RpfG family c-di-GMP phosphodiesterase
MSQDINYDVFLSHSSEDKGAVCKIAENLKDAGLRVWFDSWAIPSGGDILHEIEKGIQQSRVLVLCMSPDSLKSDWVLMERTTALFRDPANKNRRFIPLLLSPCESLPEALARFKYIKYYENHSTAISQLINDCSQSKTITLATTDQKTDRIMGILFVDDEEKTRKVFLKQFQDDFPVFLSPSVEEALLLLKSKHKEIALAIVDQRLPKRNGNELLGIIRKNYPKILRILVSAYSDHEAMADAINIANPSAYIYKPWDLSHLRICIESALEAFWANEMSPGFNIPIAPSKIDNNQFIKKTTSRSYPSIESNSDDKLGRIFEELEIQKKMLHLQEQQIRDLVRQGSNEKYLDKTQNRSEPISSGTSVAVMMSHSVKPTVSAIVGELNLIVSGLDYDQLQLRSFWIFRDRHASRISQELSKIAHSLSLFNEAKPLNEQINFITALHALRKLISEAIDASHSTHKIINRSIGGSTSIQNLSKHFSVLANYLGLNR